jgi:nicotinamide-nucleotide amidase
MSVHTLSYQLEQLRDRLLVHNLMVAVAESCTGGGIASAMTSLAGSSHWFDRGFVTYSNSAKIEMLGVATSLLATYGAVSEQTAAAMAQGALANSHAGISVAVTGIAGPDGGTEQKPVGTVCLAWSNGQTTRTTTMLFTGDRASIREQAVALAIEGLLEILDSTGSQ